SRFQFVGARLNAEQQSTPASLGREWLSAQQNDARTGGSCMGEDLWEIKIVGQGYILVLTGVSKDVYIGCFARPKRGPVGALITSRDEELNPTGSLGRHAGARQSDART